MKMIIKYVSVFILFLINMNLLASDFIFTRAHYTYADLVNKYAHSAGDDAHFQIVRNGNNEKCFYIESFFLKQDLTFKSIAFFRLFFSDSISHYVETCTIAVDNSDMTWLMNDDQVIDFLQTSKTNINSEIEMKQTMNCFAQLRSYDICLSKDLLRLDKKNLVKQNGDLKWGVGTFYSESKMLRGFMTVITDIGSPNIITRYEFGLTKSKKLRLVDKKTVYDSSGQGGQGLLHYK